jgi:hypothetical protein
MRKILLALLAISLAALLILAGSQSTLAQATSTPTLVVPDGTSWHGYALIEIAAVGPFAAGVSDTQKARLHEAFEMLAQTHDGWPPYLLQDSRWRLDNLALIVEARFVSMPKKATVVQLIANRTGYTTTQVNNALTFTVFAHGGTWAESREACAAYLVAHSAEWENSIP